MTYINFSLEDKKDADSRTLYASMVLNSATIEEVSERGALVAIESYILGGRQGFNLLRLIVRNDMIPEQLNAAIDLTAFLNVENPTIQVEEAINGTIRMLLDGMNERIQTELKLTKAQQQPNAIIRNELRRLVDVYGIDAFAKALKQFEREGI